MTHRIPAYARLAELRTLYAAQKSAIRRRLDEFVSVPPEEHFFELVYCLLTPQSTAVSASKAVESLRRIQPWDDRDVLAEVLRRRSSYVRFHNTKARNILEARLRFPLIAEQLQNARNAADLRQWLVLNVRGLGWKEASHFLRNIGYRNLAILDRHILKNLSRHRVIRSVPRTLTPKRYLRIEHQYDRFARSIGIPMDELDLLFWSRETGEILK